MMKHRFLRSIRLLSECYHAFEQMSGAHVRHFRLTPSQFDIIATLGNTQGMSFKELGEKTLITKGTLTGVVDRLETKGLVKRMTQHDDRRMTIVKLTSVGEEEFTRIFDAHLSHCKQPFCSYSEKDFEELDHALTKLQNHLKSALKKPLQSKE
jgi:MarR family 2-MHQ and catechol resistance regulon transcriptional repressor